MARSIVILRGNTLDEIFRARFIRSETRRLNERAELSSEIRQRGGEEDGRESSSLGVSLGLGTSRCRVAGYLAIAAKARRPRLEAKLVIRWFPSWQRGEERSGMAIRWRTVARQTPGKRFPRVSNDPDEVTRRQIPFSRRGETLPRRLSDRPGREDEDENEDDDGDGEMKLDPTTRASVLCSSRESPFPSASFPSSVAPRADRRSFCAPPTR